MHQGCVCRNKPTLCVRAGSNCGRQLCPPKSGWYDQDQNEWVLVLKGAARLAFEDGSEVSMGPGDSLEIPAHVKHKVVWTDPDEETVWVGVRYM